MKRSIKENETISTLKNAYEIWEERPKIISSEITSEPDFSHMIHRIEHHNQILHVAMGLVKDKSNVSVERPSIRGAKRPKHRLSKYIKSMT